MSLIFSKKQDDTVTSNKVRLSIYTDKRQIKLNLELPEFGIIGLTGETGSGKTTILRAIAGLDKHLGSNQLVQLQNEIWQQQARILPVNRRSLAMVFQESALYPHLTAKQNIEITFKGIDNYQQHSTLKLLTQHLKLEDILSKKVSELSGGQARKIAIARAFARVINKQAKVLLMDEPMTGLDSNSQHLVHHFIKRLCYRYEILTIYVSHQIDTLVKISDHIVHIDEQQQIFFEPTYKLLCNIDSPIRSTHELTNLLSFKVIETTNKSTTVLVEKSYLTIPSFQLLPWQTRLMVHAKDVGISLAWPDSISAQHIFKGIIGDIKVYDSSTRAVIIQLNTQELISLLPNTICHKLNLKAGKTVYAFFNHFS